MAKQNILIVDDEPNLLESFKIGLELKDYIVSIAASGKKALEAINKRGFDVVLLDIRMPGMDGLETLTEIKKVRPDQVVIMLTGQGSLESAVEAGRIGAYDYLEKPSTPEAVHLRIQKAVEHQAVKQKLEDIETLVGDDFAGVIGKSQAISEVFDLLTRVAPTDSTILITGETGTGKELIASALHLHSRRRDNRFFALHCAAIPEELLESELFGHEKGSFTGAVAQKTGYFEAADGGTLFLDEIGELSQAEQVRLLRVLQEREFIRVGSTTPIKTDVRLVAATNRNLEEEVKEGRFREDLVLPVERHPDPPAPPAGPEGRHPLAPSAFPHQALPRGRPFSRHIRQVHATIGATRVARKRARTRERERACSRPLPGRHH